MSLYSLVPSALDPQTQDAKNNLVRPTRLVFASAKILVLSALNPQNQSVKKKKKRCMADQFFCILKNSCLPSALDPGAPYEVHSLPTSRQSLNLGDG